MSNLWKYFSLVLGLVCDSSEKFHNFWKLFDNFKRPVKPVDPWSNPRANLEEFLEKNAVHKNLWKFFTRFILELGTSSQNFRNFRVSLLPLKILPSFQLI